MGTQEGSLCVSNGTLDCMQERFQKCSGINVLQDPSSDLSSNPKKRKASQSIGSPPSSEVNAARVRLPSHPTGAGPSSQPDPEPQQSGKGGSEPSTPSQIPRKCRILGKCLAKACQGAKWREIQLELGLDTVDKYEQVIQRFQCRAHVVSERECVKEPGQSNCELIAFGKKLAAVTKSSRGNTGHLKLVYYFQVLTLLSYCEFLRAKGVSGVDTDQLLETIIPREQDRNALQRSIVRVHELIVELIGKGWTVERATELIFINAAPPSVLVRYGSDKNFEALLENLSADTFMNGNFDDCLTPSFTIPGIIASHFDFADRTDQNWLNEIYNALGYDLPVLLSSVKGTYKVQPAKSAPICPRFPEYNNLTLNSFDPAHFSSTPAANKHITVSFQDREERTSKSIENSSIDPNFKISVSRSFQSNNGPRTHHPPGGLTSVQQSQAREKEAHLARISPSAFHINASAGPFPELCYNIRVYFEHSCRNLVFDDYGTLLFPNGAKVCNDLCDNFDSYCFTATMLNEKKLYHEFRQALGKATALVQQILQAEHPRTLACFFEVLLHLIQNGLPKIASMLRDFIKSMSSIIIKKENPWSRICRLLGELDLESCEQNMARAWEHTTDIFTCALGSATPLAVSVRLDYIKRVYGITDCVKEERLLRDLLVTLGGIPKVSTPRVMLNLAHNLNRQRRHEEAEKIGLEVLKLLQGHEMYVARMSERIESLKLLSHSYFNQGMIARAEQGMRSAIQMIERQLGRHHSWALEFRNVLEDWLRSWGREEDANTLQVEIAGLFGEDEMIE